MYETGFIVFFLFAIKWFGFYQTNALGNTHLNITKNKLMYT